MPKSTADYFIDSFNQSMDTVFKLDTMERQKQMAMMQMAEHLMRGQELVRRQNARLQMIESLKDVSQEAQGPPNEAGEYPTVMAPSPLKKSLQETYGPMYPLAEQTLRSGGDVGDLAHIPKPSQANSLDALIAKAVQGGNQDEIDRLIGIKQRMFREEQDKTPSIPMFVEKDVGPGITQKYKYNPETKEHDIPFGAASPKWKPTPEGDASKESINERRFSAMAWDDVQAKFGVKGAHIDPLTQQAIYPKGVNQAQIEAYYKERFDYHKNRMGGNKTNRGNNDPLKIRK